MYEATCLKKYGIKNSFHSPKSKETCIERYGSEHWSNSEIGKKTLSDIISTETVQSKTNISKCKNNSFNKSKPEEESYIILKEKYTEVLRQYRSELYPFNCDFYIPEIDLYIECNYSWTHGLKPYENTEEDNIKLNKWKSKNTKFYNKAIETWTIRDVNKRNIAKKNNLNYIEFYNINELRQFINKDIFYQ